MRFGLLAIFLGAAVEGDLALVLGGVAAHLRLLDPFATVLAGAAGGFAGDSVLWAIGRRAADAVHGLAAYQRVAPVLERLVRRFGEWELPLARVFYGSRVVSMLFWGTQGMPYARFATFDAPACAAWAILLVTLGFTGSRGAEALLGRVEAVERWLFAGVLVVGAVALARHWFVRRRVG